MQSRTSSSRRRQRQHKPTTMVKEKILLEGWLEKKSPKKVTKEHDLFNTLPSVWQKRYFVLVRVGVHQAELRYFGKMTPSAWGNSVSDRKGAIPIRSTRGGRCSVSREGSTSRRFSLTAPRVSGSKHGVGVGSKVAATTLHQFALRAGSQNEARKWYVALHLFLRGDYNAGLSDSDSGSESDDDIVPTRSTRADSEAREANRRAALRRRRLAARRVPAPVQAPAPMPMPTPAPRLIQRAAVVRSAPPVVQQYSPPRSNRNPRLADSIIPGIRSARQIERDNGISDSNIAHLAASSKLQSQPPAGVRRASAMIGKSIFLDAHRGNGQGSNTTYESSAPSSSRSHQRTVSEIHRELGGITHSGHDVVDAPYEHHQLAGARLSDAPPGIRTASMMDLGVSAATRTDYYDRSASTVHNEVEAEGWDYVPPPPAPEYIPPPPLASTRTDHRRRFSLIGDILDGTAHAADAHAIPPAPSATYGKPASNVSAVRSSLNRSPSRRTNRSRTYSSTLESVGEQPRNESSRLLQSALELYQGEQINKEHYGLVKAAIERNDVHIVNAFKNYLTTMP